MLILRQVLTAEKSKATPAEVENSVAELFKDLVKMLDSSPDAGTGEIVEAMIRASASVGSPSEERIQTRRQVIGRVFVKSVQPDDAVFKNGLPGRPPRLPRRRPGWRRRQGQEAGRRCVAPRRRREARRRGGEGCRGGDQGGHGVGEGPWPVVHSSDVNVNGFVFFIVVRH